MTRTRAFVATVVFFLLSVSSGVPAVEWHVAPAPLGNDSNPGTSDLPFATVQRGIDASSDGDTVIVAEGTYVENVRFNGKNIVLTSTDPLNPTIVANTIIDGNKAGSVVTFSGTESEACVLSGFTIRNGEFHEGGGIYGGTYPDSTHATIRNNVIKGNTATGGRYECHYGQCYVTAGDGGGLYGCAGLIESNVINENFALPGSDIRVDPWGGGLCWCDGTIRSNRISKNFAYYGGGLCWCNGTIERNAIRENHATCGGGLSMCDGLLRNNLIAGNTGTGGGLADCDGNISNNTIAGNSDSGSYGKGGGLYGCSASIVNCVIWGNTAPEGTQLWNCSRPAYSCIEGWTEGGEGNIAPPSAGFVDPDGPDNAPATYEDNDYRLSAASPCIDAGLNSPDLPEFDIAGMHRIMFGGKSLTVDMGAYEFHINTLSRAPFGNARLTWSSLGEKTYRVERSRDMLTWETAEESVFSAGNTTTTWIDTTAPFVSHERTRYYRTVEK